MNVHLHKSGEKTAELTCNWCGEPHAVEPEYREDVLLRGAKILAEYKSKDIKIKDIKPEQTWTCGRCFLVLHNHPSDFIPTDCHEHEVPKEKIEFK